MTKQSAKYTITTYIKADRALKAKLDAYAEKIQQRRAKLAAKYIKQNSPVENGKVYNLVSGGIKRRGYDRFVVFQQQARSMGGHSIVVVGGWWINKLTNKAEKWDSSAVVLGVSNPAVFKLAEDQNYINPDEE